MKPKDNEFANIQYLLMIVNVLPLLRTALIAFYKCILLGTLAWKDICVGEMSIFQSDVLGVWYVFHCKLK